MATFDQTGVTGLIGLWEFANGNETADTGLADNQLAQDGTFESDASASGGRANFNGTNDRFDVEGDNGGQLESEFDLSSGTIEVQFSQDVHLGNSVDTIVNRGEFADRTTEGYFSISVTENGAVEVVHFAGGESVSLTTSDDFFEPGETVNVKYTWDEDLGVQLTATNGNDVEVLTDDTLGLNFDIGDNDDEIFTFGARESDDGDYAQEFDGSVDYVAVYDSTLPAEPDGVVDGEAFDEEMVLNYDDANDPTDGGGDKITDGDDVIFGNGGSDTIDGAAGDDTIFGDSADAGPVEREIFQWGDAPGFADGADADDFSQNTGTANVEFSILNQSGPVENEYETETQNTDDLDNEVAEDESFQSVLRNADDTATYQWSSDVPVENVEFRVNDIDGDGVVQIRAFDPDGNPIEVVLSDVGSDLAASDTDGVPGNDQVASTDDDYTPDANGIHSVLVTIPGPVETWQVIHSMSGGNDSGINFTDITFDISQPDLGPAGDDVITGGAGADVMFGQDGDDTFIVDTAADGDGDDVDGGNGPDDSADNDTLDLRGTGKVTIVDDVDPDDDGARAGTVTFESGEVLTFSGIETILTDPQNEAPDVIANDVTIDENTTPVQDVDANDPDGDTVEFSISGGADAALFEIDPVSGQLDFITAPNFEDPLDDDGDNVYEVEVTATDPGGLSDSQLVNVTVADVNEAPDVTGPADVDVDENVTGVIADFDATDPDAGDSVTFSLTGDDAALFDIDPDTGELSFIIPPDFENPADADGDNEYEVTVVGTDDGGLTDTQDVVITVADVNEADGIVDGEEIGEDMEPLYNDADGATDGGGDIIDGPDGLDDVIEGNGGNDIIDSGLGDDTVDGGSGDDEFDINEEGNGIDNDVITGGETGETDGDLINTDDIDDDLVVDFTAPEEGTITDGTDTTTFEEIENLQLGGGDDTVNGSDGDENVDGGAGNDSLDGGDGRDTLSGGEGNDTIEGDEGNDVLDGGDDDDLIDGGTGGDRIDGGEGNDTIDAGDDRDTVDGGDGDDEIDGGLGNDVLDGGDGDDTIEGGSQQDTVDGGDGEDEIDAGSGFDVILSSDGADTIDGGNGRDTYRDNTDETIEVDVNSEGDGTVLRVGDGTVDQIESIETFIADEAPDEADVITLTDPIPVDDVLTEINGLDDNSIGTFTPANGDPVVSFGGPGEPVLSEVLGGAQPAGDYQITDGDEGGRIGAITFDNFEEINFTVEGALPDGAVDGEEDGETMVPGYDDSNAPTDQGGDIIDGPDGLDDTIFGNGGDDIIDSGLGDDTVDGGDGDDRFVIVEEGNGIDNDVITGGEGDEDAGGDTIDTTDIDDDLVVEFTDPEEGTITDGADTTTFEEIENLELGGGDDSVTGSDGAENVDGGDGNNTLIGEGGDDTLTGGGDADTIDGGDGDDVLEGGGGDDEITGGAGSDTVTDLEGNNVIDTSDPDFLTARPDREFPGYPSDPPVPFIPADDDPENDRDSVTTGEGNDSITTGDDKDTINSGGGEDTINAGIDDDLVNAGDENDIVTAGEGNDTVDGGEGNDTIFGGLGPSVPDAINIPDDGSNGIAPDPDPDNGRDLLDGGRGDDLIFGEDDDDTLIGGIGNDTLDGGIDDDSLQGDIGFDSLIGGQGDDTLDGGRGRDTMLGGDGNDVFIENANDGADRIDDFNVGNTGSINDGDQTNNDFVDLSAFYNAQTLFDVNENAILPFNNFATEIGMLRADAADGRIDGVINGEDLSSFIGGVDLTLQDGNGNAVTGSDLTFDNTNVAGIICFVRGTQIATRNGSVLIEDLKAGDEVITMDHGFQKIRWIGSTTVGASGNFAPVVIRKGAMGNERDLRVSPQHRMLVRGWHVELMFGQKEALVPAKALINDETVFQLEGGNVEYFHMMFDRHELVYAEGIPSESFHPGHVGLGSFAEDTREEILTLFPELREDVSGYSDHARPSLKVREAKVLAENPELMKE